ncbi:hypothetical protein [Phytohabitans houttuyneae]|uniref:Uncharacterized protein n=1 Tax=Phytohabitans houttuyneae TaxID=1076126 RepID=A0A6V8KLU9_9ACTN|nr:hypothetical protein [Phytohabitans houttuyneae]GFJ83391.1 hypothetical protein Phou_075710 [Phytohabitans houttuyneae]
MSTTWRHLPTSARAIAVTATDAVAAAQAHDRDGLAAAAGPLAAAEGSGLVLGTAVRLLLEEAHPDGLAGDDVRHVIEQCTRAAAAWEPAVDPHVLLILLAGALGVHDPDEQAPRPDPEVLARHAALLVAHLLAATPQPFTGYLTAAFAEIERTELHD